MIVSINQPAYIPYLGYFDRIMKSDVHVVLDHVQFEKNSFTNRNKVLTRNGPVMLTIPVQNKLGTPINEIDIAGHDWRKKHMMTIQQAYAKAPHAGWLADFELLYTSFPAKRLMTEINCFTNIFLRKWDIKTPMIHSSQRFSGAELGKKSDLVLNICKELGARVYLSGPLGRDYLNLYDFELAGIEVKFHEYIPAPYPQLNPGFIPYLSAIDALFNTEGFPCQNY